jgi:hypothetical protein
MCQNNNQNNRDNRNNRNNRNKHHGQRNPCTEDKEQKDMKVPIWYQTRSSKETSTVEFKYEIDGNTEKTKLNVYEDSNDEESQHLL